MNNRQILSFWLRLAEVISCSVKIQKLKHTGAQSKTVSKRRKSSGSSPTLLTRRMPQRLIVHKVCVHAPTCKTFAIIGTAAMPENLQSTQNNPIYFLNAYLR